MADRRPALAARSIAMTDDPSSPETQAPVETPAEDRFAAFRNARFLRYWLARFLAAFAVQVVAVSVAGRSTT